MTTRRGIRRCARAVSTEKIAIPESKIAVKINPTTFRNENIFFMVKPPTLRRFLDGFSRPIVASILCLVGSRKAATKTLFRLKNQWQFPTPAGPGIRGSSRHRTECLVRLSVPDRRQLVNPEAELPSHSRVAVADRGNV